MNESVIVPACLFTKDVTDAQRLVYGQLKAADGLVSYPGMRLTTGLTIKAVSQALHDLEHRKLIAISRSGPYMTVEFLSLIHI